MIDTAHIVPLTCIFNSLGFCFWPLFMPRLMSEAVGFIDAKVMIVEVVHKRPLCNISGRCIYYKGKLKKYVVCQVL